MRVLTVTYAIGRDETKVKIAAEFLEYADGLLKSDVLGDAINLISQILDDAKVQYIDELSAQTGRSVDDVKAGLAAHPMFSQFVE